MSYTRKVYIRSLPALPSGGIQTQSRGERIRTSDPLLPKQVRYQAAPRPAKTCECTLEYSKEGLRS